MKKIDKNELEIYLDYINNFATVSTFAEYYGISVEEANKILLIGANLNNIKGI